MKENAKINLSNTISSGGRNQSAMFFQNRSRDPTTPPGKMEYSGVFQDSCLFRVKRVNGTAKSSLPQVNVSSSTCLDLVLGLPWALLEISCSSHSRKQKGGWVGGGGFH